MVEARRTTMSDLARLDAELNQMILAGKAMEAFEKFYAEEATMQENDEPPTVGKAANRTREEQFFGSIEQFHGITLDAQAVGDGVTMSQWTTDLQLKGMPRMKYSQAAIRHWKDGKIVAERFLHK
jgi:hypothetical protein